MNNFLSDFSFDNKLVLDFGCGIGSSSYMFHPDYYIGIDCDNKRISYAQHLYPKYKFISSQGNEFELNDNSIDYIYISAVLHHIPTSLVESYLQEFRRILKNSGQVLVIEPCFFKGSNIRNWFMASFDKGKYIKNKQDYLDLFHKHKFKTSNIKSFSKCGLYNEIFFVARPLK